MRPKTIHAVRCMRCPGRLAMNGDHAVRAGDIAEGMAVCAKCGAKYPVLQGVLILVEDPVQYLGNRPRLAGRLLVSCTIPAARLYVRGALRQASGNDYTHAEERWTAVYAASRRSAFYRTIRGVLGQSKCRSVIEHGCSVGIMQKFLSARCTSYYGVDRSFSSVLEARRAMPSNCDCIVSDSQGLPFGRAKFDLVACLNMLEVTEPAPLVSRLASQAKSRLVISDPYDYDRPGRTVRRPLGPCELRKAVRACGMRTTRQTASPQRIRWTLRLADRARLVYHSDLVDARRPR